MWFLSGIGEVPTPNVQSDVWDHVESYMLRILLACRLKIIPTSNLKLIISFLILHIVLLSLFKSLSLVASTRQTHSTLHVYLRLANCNVSGLIHKKAGRLSNYKEVWHHYNCLLSFARMKLNHWHARCTCTSVTSLKDEKKVLFEQCKPRRSAVQAEQAAVLDAVVPWVSEDTGAPAIHGEQWLQWCRPISRSLQCHSTSHTD